MMKRVNPTEKAINGKAFKLLARFDSTLWVKEPVKEKTKPMKGRPEGPGMAVVRLRALERAQARPPGVSQKAKTAIKRKRKTESSQLRTEGMNGK